MDARLKLSGMTVRSIPVTIEMIWNRRSNGVLSHQFLLHLMATDELAEQENFLGTPLSD